MNRDRARELLPIIQAFAEGKAIECKINAADSWDETEGSHWHDDFEYRIKPEPFECWVIKDNDNTVNRLSAYKTLSSAPAGWTYTHMREVTDE